ncbi:alpha/beta hydrolase [Sodalinema gerasimenkoae]|uniref:alpha/beta hydrolase n=1 Tax=Sodalinema gerasimenkoae TaxID=2862348 RepID=UPI00135B8F85|nr:alpha/beta hydrolase [Sodalinema gerasimenkoae]
MRRLCSRSTLVFCGLLLSSLILSVGLPGWGAQTITASYSLFERSVSVDALETYARTGEIERDLAPYIRFAPPQVRENIREALLARADVDVVAVSQFLYTPQGEALLQRLGQAIRLGSGGSGYLGLRSALILAAADKTEGLTLLNVLRHFPTDTVRLDFNQTLRMAQELQTLIRDNNQAVSMVESQSLLEAQGNSGGMSSLRNLTGLGDYSWEVSSLDLRDRDRALPWGYPLAVDLYLPRGVLSAPIVVISHGLGSNRESFRYLAEHLVSHGFAVLVPEHSGSSARHMDALLRGRAQEIARPQEFLDRPLDVTFALNSLEKQAITDRQLSDRLDFKRVGVIGQSFGGYTALTLAGASLNFPELQSRCGLSQQRQSWNVSLFLQCRALDLFEIDSRDEINFRDGRVQGIIALNPIGSALFGPEGYGSIEIPVMLLAGGADTVSPAIAEQIPPFAWLTSPHKYFVLLREATHFSVIGNSEQDNVALPLDIIGPNPRVAQSYVKALSLAFLQTHIAGNEEFAPYLNAAYAQEMSQEPIGLFLVQGDFDGFREADSLANRHL